MPSRFAPALLFFLLLPSLALATKQGGDSSGGGCSYAQTPGAQPILLDYALYAVNYRPPGTAGDILENSRATEQLGFDRFDAQDTSAMALARERVESRRAQNPLLVTYVLQALNKLELFRTRFQQVEVHATCLHPSVAPAKTQQVVIYSDLTGAMVSMPAWNRLDRESQAGLLVHEALRFVQISGERDELDTEKIMLLTTYLMLGKARGLRDLQQSEWFGETRTLQRESKQLRKDLPRQCASLETRLRALGMSWVPVPPVHDCRDLTTATFAAADEWFHENSKTLYDRFSEIFAKEKQQHRSQDMPLASRYLQLSTDLLQVASLLHRYELKESLASPEVTGALSSLRNVFQLNKLYAIIDVANLGSSSLFTELGHHQVQELFLRVQQYYQQEIAAGRLAE